MKPPQDTGEVFYFALNINTDQKIITHIGGISPKN